MRLLPFYEVKEIVTRLGLFADIFLKLRKIHERNGIVFMFSFIIMPDFFTCPQVEFYKCLASYRSTEMVEQYKSMADACEIDPELVI